MINAIIFSKDRAMQLRLLLESIEKNASDIFNINIIYTYSNEDYKNAYLKLQKENILNNINWINENELKKQVIDALNMNYEFSCFFTDDDIIYNKIENIEGALALFTEIPELFCFSLRLGKNTTRCYNMNTNNILVDEKEIKKDFIFWNWSKHYLDFGYPLSIDGHIFKTKDIKKITANVKFQNPNELEIAWQIFDNFPKEIMASYKISRLVNSPNNMVQNIVEKINGETYNMNQKELNEQYLNGKTIDFSNLNFSEINGCNQKLELLLK